MSVTDKMTKCRWDDMVEGKLKYSEYNLTQCHFIHHKFHMGWPGIETGPPL